MVCRRSCGGIIPFGRLGEPRSTLDQGDTNPPSLRAAQYQPPALSIIQANGWVHPQAMTGPDPKAAEPGNFEGIIDPAAVGVDYGIRDTLLTDGQHRSLTPRVRDHRGMGFAAATASASAAKTVLVDLAQAVHRHSRGKVSRDGLTQRMAEANHVLADDTEQAEPEGKAVPQIKAAPRIGHETLRYDGQSINIFI